MATTWKLPKEPIRPPLTGEIRADVVVVGGGITGILSAYLLAEAGTKVVLLEKECLNESMTAYTTAFITCVIDTHLEELVSLFGRDKTKKIWQSGMNAIDEIERIVAREKIDCEFMRCDGYIFANSSHELDAVKKEAELGSKLGFPIALSDRPLRIESVGAALIQNQAKFHPLKFLTALRKAAEAKGAKFFEKSEAVAIEGSRPATVRTKRGSIKADHVIIATYNPFNHPKELFARKGPYASYILELEIPKSTLPEAIYEDMKNPYNYFRVDAGDKKDRVIIGGADHREELPLKKERAHRAVEDFFVKILPDVPYTIVKKWKGLILEPLDGIPYIGRFSKKARNRYVAMGFSGNGMTYATISAMLFRDLILGRNNAYEKVYDPKRNATFYQLWRKGKDYVGEFFGGVPKLMFKKSRPRKK